MGNIKKYNEFVNEAAYDSNGRKIEIADAPGAGGPPDHAKKTSRQVFYGIVERSGLKSLDHAQWFGSYDYVGIKFMSKTQKFLIIHRPGRVTREDQIIGSIELIHKDQNMTLAEVKGEYTERGYGDVKLTDKQIEQAIELFADEVFQATPFV